MFLGIPDGSSILRSSRSMPPPPPPPPPPVYRLSDITAANHVAPNVITLIIIAPQVLPDVATADLHEDIGQMAKEGVEETVSLFNKILFSVSFFSFIGILLSHTTPHTPDRLSQVALILFMISSSHPLWFT